MSGTLFIVTAPSGAGKTTLVQALVKEDTNVRLSVSYTTRKPRPGEKDGREYHFIDQSTFFTQRDRGEYLEWAEVHGNFYATSQKWLQEQMAAGHDMLLEIDWQGARQVRGSLPDAISIFILPPSLEELENRLKGRGTDSPEVISNRLQAARGEMRHIAEFDYVILNRDLSVALNDLMAVVHAERLRYHRQYQRSAQFFDFLKQD